MRKIPLYIFLWFCFLMSFTSKAQLANSVGVNVDFEATALGSYTTANAVNGWTISSQTVTSCNTSTVWQAGSPEFSVMSTPVSNVPGIGTLPNSPLGGLKIVRLNNTVANGNRTKIAQTFTLPYNNANNASGYVFQYAFAGVWQDAGHLCCEQPHFKVEFKDCQGNILSCSSMSFVAYSSSGCPTGTMIYTISPGYSWTSWQIRNVDLTMSSNTSSCITVEITNQDCTVGDHYGTVFFDAKIIPYWNGTSSSANSNTSIVNICPGQYAVSISPLLFFSYYPPYSSYSWTGYYGSGTFYTGQSTPTLNIFNPVSGSVYTLNTSLYIVSNSPCPITRYYVIQTATLNPTVLTDLTCLNGASGSATVLTNMSGGTYNYSWVNSTNSVVSTNSFAPNLALGLYSVMVNAPNYPSCGVSTSTVMINNSAPSLSYVAFAPYCNNGEAYLDFLNTPSNSTNFQWYSGTVAIPANQGGTAPTYTVVSPINNSIYSLTYDTPQGCRDSVEIYLQASPSGSITVSSATPACQGASNGNIAVHFTPSPNSPQTTNSYFVAENGNALTPAYIYSNSPASYNTFTLSNLYAGGVYSLSAFDGMCKYNTTYTVNTLSFDYTLSPNTVSLCSGNTAFVQPIIGSPSSYTYSWSPSTFLSNTNAQLTTITPTTAQGSSLNIVYSVVVTPTINNCPLTKTISVSLYNPETPTLTPLTSTYCSNTGTVDISANANPTGGIFYFNAYSNTSGLLNTFLSYTGINTYTYSNAMANCAAFATGTYTIRAAPQVSMASTAGITICIGNSVTLSASGADSYTWSNAMHTPSITVVPLQSTTYYVSGTDEYGCVSNSASIFLPVAPLPTLDVNGTFTLCNPQTLKLTVSGAQNYYWSWGASSFATSTFIIVSPMSTTQYSVTGTSNYGCTSSKVITVSIMTCTDIDELKNENEKLKIYPNPTNGKFIIETTTTNDIQITDVSGKLIFENQFQSGKHEIDLSEFANGIYFVKTKSGGNQKIVISH